MCKHSEELDINLLIGADLLWQFRAGRIVRGRLCEPATVQIRLGLVLSGAMKCRYESQNREGVAQVKFITQNSATSERLENRSWTLWDLETLGIREVDDVQEE